MHQTVLYVPSFTDGKGFASKGRFLLVKLTVLYENTPMIQMLLRSTTPIPTCRWSTKCPSFRGMRRPGLSQRLTTRTLVELPSIFLPRTRVNKTLSDALSFQKRLLDTVA